MSDVVIAVENLSKSYRLGVIGSGTLTNDLKVWWAKRRGRPNPLAKIGQADHHNRDGETVWALRDVSFTVKQGEVLGIIGKNGAGKSTLLKILSRVTAPTSGEVKVKGRIASLLEVGTGFHPELTGRENIYLNGAILGMRRAEIDRKLDEIVDFAGVETYLDTPVKRYSSGMYVRLAFAVAAHLEPEILVVDEVLAVGDAEFQQKCLGKMEKVANEGRTVIFVSHNMGAVKALCTKGIFLQNGRISVDADVGLAISSYINFNAKESLLIYQSLQRKKQPYISVATIHPNGVNENIDIDKPVRMTFQIETYKQKELVIGIVIRNTQGVWVHHSSDEFRSNYSPNASGLRQCEIPPYGLTSGRYYVDLFLAQRNHELFECIDNALIFDVQFVGQMSDRTTSSIWKGICGPGIITWY